MNTIALQLASASALTTLVTWAVYFAKVPGGDVPARPVGSIAAQVLSLVLVVAAVGLQAQHGGVTDLGALIGVTIPAGFGAMMAVLFLYLLAGTEPKANLFAFGSVPSVPRRPAKTVSTTRVPPPHLSLRICAAAPAAKRHFC